jgi:hypothetical protein
MNNKELYEIEVSGPGSEGRVRMMLNPDEQTVLSKFAQLFNTDPENNHHSAPFITVKRVV